MEKIRVNQVSKIFGRQPKRGLQLVDQGLSKQEILKQTGMTLGVNKVSFTVNHGEIFVVMGLSGSGKSTLIRLLNRLIEPTSGEILIDGKDIVSMNKEELLQVRRKKLGMVFQRFALFPHRTIVENIEYGLEIQGVTKKERMEKALRTLHLVGLEGYEHRYPDELSGGMQQRVGLARALANDPDILLMDEAFSALDPLIRKEMQDELLELQSSMQKTIVFITHDLNEALRLGDRIALMRDGKIVQIGTPEEIMMNPANDYVERFVEDVDLAKVLTATHVLKRAETMNIDRGPRVALQLMRERGISTIYVVNRQQELLGVVTAKDAAQAVKDGISIEEIMIRELTTVSPDAHLTDLFDKVATASIPIAVVDDRNRLRGIIVRGAVLGALAGNWHESEQEVR